MAVETEIALCVLLWAHAGEEPALIAYEDAVLQLLPAHGGRVLQRARTNDTDDGPLEIQLLTFPSEMALEAYMNDPQRAALTADRERAIARTAVHRVALV
jgi:uncharacterized protein (DUF1330 family)